MKLRDRIIPSMFHRRLVLLTALTLLAMAGLSARLAWLTVAQADQWRHEAEARLVTETWTPTVRGKVLDRKGRVLALDRPSFDVSVEYRVITGDWAYQQASAQAKREHRADWGKLGGGAREKLIAEKLSVFQERLETMWRLFAETAGIDREELEKRKQAIIERVERAASTIWARRLMLERQQMKDEEKDEEPTVVRRPIREQLQRHAILRNVDDHTAFNFRSVADSMPGLAVMDAGQREYPYENVNVAMSRASLPAPLRRDGSEPVRVEGVATHILGWMRNEPQREDYTRRPAVDPATGETDRGRYEAGDAVGAAGVEASQEDALRGLRGRIVQHLDTGEREVVAPTKGKDIALTIDIALQARVQAILDPEFGLTRVQEWHELHQPESVTEGGKRELVLPSLGDHLNGAAVVLEVETGDVLALVSSPSFTRAELRSAPELIFDDPLNQAWVNRPLARPYQPGSIVKPLVLCEAETTGAHRLEDPIECTGHFLPDRTDILKCWIFRKQFGYTTHSAQMSGPLYAVDAIARSCNIYFYTLGKALGLERIMEMYGRYSVGTAFDTGLPGAAPGLIGRTDRAPMTFIDAALMGIGQGPVAWTPLHAANAYATLARRGVKIEPRIVAGIEHAPIDLHLSKAAIEQALEGLHQGVSDVNGTGNHITVDGKRESIFNVPGVRLSGKTGTATTVATLGVDPDAAGPEHAKILREGDHAWTVVLAGPENGPPRYAIAVVIEHAGSGGKVAGPVANQILHALVDEGYLRSGGS